MESDQPAMPLAVAATPNACDTFWVVKYWYMGGRGHLGPVHPTAVVTQGSAPVPLTSKAPQE